MKRRIFVILAVVVVLLLVGGYLGAGVMIYNRLADVSVTCEDRSNTPGAFTAQYGDEDEAIDAEPYLIANYESVSFPSREASITVSGWYAPAEDETDAPAVILVHGLRGCKYSASVLLPAGMLHAAGFNALLIDLRDHGDSTIEDGRYAGGTEEYRDVLGAWDWLVNEKGIPSERIGLFGVSLGAATVMIATGEEPRVAAVWEDSGFADIRVALDAELERNGFPTFLAAGGLLMARLMAGDDLTALSPLDAVSKLDGRPVFITHGTADRRLSVQYAYDLTEAIRAQGGAVEPWIVEGAEHVEAMFTHTAEYAEKLVGFFSEHLR